MSDLLLNARDCLHGPDDVWIDRRSAFGNRFRIGSDGTREEVIAKHRDWLMADEQAAFRESLEVLRGKRLICWCRPLPCHGETIIWYLYEQQELQAWLSEY